MSPTHIHPLSHPLPLKHALSEVQRRSTLWKRPSELRREACHRPWGNPTMLRSSQHRCGFAPTLGRWALATYPFNGLSDVGCGTRGDCAFYKKIISLSVCLYFCYLLFFVTSPPTCSVCPCVAVCVRCQCCICVCGEGDVLCKLWQDTPRYTQSGVLAYREADLCPELDSYPTNPFPPLFVDTEGCKHVWDAQASDYGLPPGKLCLQCHYKPSPFILSGRPGLQEWRVQASNQGMAEGQEGDSSLFRPSFIILSGHPGLQEGVIRRH
jgi:hypothetical protein